MSLRAGTPPPVAEAVRLELGAVYDAAEIAEWFARANAWLGGLTPAELAGRAPHEVLQAARADRFVARG